MYAVGRLSNYISQGVYTVSAPFHPFGGAVDIIVVQQEDGTYKSTPWYVKFGKFQGVLKHREKIVTVSVNGSEADFHMYLDHKGEAYFLKEVESDEDDTILSPPSAPSSGDEGTDRQYSGRRISFKDDDFPRKIEGEEKAADDGGLEMPLANSPPPESIVGQNKEEILISFSEQSSGSCEKQVGSESPDGSSSKPSSTDAKNGTKNGKNISKSSSRKSIFSLVFRGRSQKNSESPVNASFTDQQGEGDDCHRVSSLERAERVADLLETKWVTGDTANRDEMTGKKSFEMSQLSGSSSSDALFVNGGSEQPEIETNSDSLVYSSLLSSSEQDIAIVGTISGESTCKSSVEILCSDVETSITEELGGSIVKLEYSVERTNSEEFYTQTEIDIAIANESADKYNDHREQITRSDPVLLSGISASAQDVGLTGADGGQNMIATPFSSLEGCLETSDSDTAPVDLVAPPFVLDVATEAFTRGCSNEEEQSEDSETQDTEDLAHIFPGIAVNESSSDCSAPILLDMNSRNSDLGDACVSGEVVDQDSFVESDKGMKTMLEAAIEPVTEGIVHSRECTEHTGKQDNEAAIHIIPGKGVNESSLCDCNTSTKITSADCNLLREVACTNKTIAHEHAEVTNSCNQLFQSRVNSALEENSQIECDLTILENVFDLEGEQNQIAQPVDEMHGVGFVCSNRYSREPDECGIEAKKTPANETSRIESREELELTFNDDYISDRGLALSEMSPSMETEEREHILPVPIERMNSECRLDGIGKINESNLEHLNDNTFQLSKRQTSPMNIPGMLKKGIGDTAQLSCSLPNMGLHFSDIQNSGTVRFYSRSLDSDSDHLKRHKGHDMLFPNSHNTEVNASEKETAQDWATAENTSESLKNLNKTETAIASVQSDTGIEISLCRHLLSEGMGIEAAAEAFDSQKVSVEEFTSLGASMVKNEKLVVKIGGRYFPWDAAAPIILGMVAFGLGGPVEPEGAIPVERAEKTLGKYASDSFVTPSGRWRLWPFGFRRLKTPERTNSARPALKDDLIVEPDAALQSTFDGTLVIKNGYCRQTGKHKVRSNTPTSEQLASLNLKEGQNIITFSFSTRVLGKQQVDARIYLWKWNTRIVVSDVDGTITKSDVLGQFMPLVGKDWTQSGVAHLFSAIKDNGYQLLFLSARAIAQAYLTRQFLLNVKQDGKALPDGPVVISPDGLFPSLYREVIRRAPHEFKIACLEDIRALFPPDCNPFYAGFGNRDTDEISYLKVGIPKGKIFIINPKGEVAVNHRVDMKSYTSLHKLVNGMFPAMSSSEQEDFNSWNYWKVPLPDIDV